MRRKLNTATRSKARALKEAASQYPEGVPDEVKAPLAHDLRMIGKLSYAPYFLTVQSAVCYVLGITAIGPSRTDLLFDRFVSEERHEPPDTDVDFEHERREEVIQWVYETDGRDRAALCAMVIHYRAKGALRGFSRPWACPRI